MLRWRLIIGVGLIAGLAGLCWLDAAAARPGIVLAGLALAATLLAAGEMLRLFATLDVRPSRGAVYFGALLPVLASSLPIAFPLAQNYATFGGAGWLGIGLTFGVMTVFACEMRRFDVAGQSISNVAHSALAVLYIGGLMGTLIELRLARAPGDIGGWRGLFPLVATIAAVKLSDTCQYAVGRLTGKHKLSPKISPGKTWEGAIGGIGIASLIAAVGIAAATQGTDGLRGAHLLLCWACTLSIAVAGIVGDLAESLLKRDAGVKDSSAWLPGFGGVLDLLDSILFAAPVGYLWFASGVLGEP